MTNSATRLLLLSTASTAAAILLLPSAAHAQATTCSQTGTTITCVEGAVTVLTAGTTPSTTTVPRPGLRTVDATGPSTTTYVASGPIATTGVPAVTLTSTGGPLTFTPSGTGAPVNISTTGGISSNGLTLNTTGQPATITVGNITTNGTNAFGVLSTGGTDLNLRTGNITTTGPTSTAIDAVNQTGNISITAGDISATGRGLRTATTTTGTNTIVVGNVATGAAGILANGGTVSVTTGTVSTSTNGGTTPGGFGVAAQAFSGNSTVRTGAVSTVNGAGIVASAFSPTGSVDVGGCPTVSTVGNNSSAIFAQTAGTGSVTVNCGVLTTTGSNSNGVFATSNGGNVIVNITSATTSGAGAFGLTANSSGTGNVTTNAGVITTTGAGSTGLFSRAGTGTIDAGYGNITTSGIAVGGNSASAVELASTGTINLRGAGSTLRTNGAGVTAALINGAGVTGNLGNVTTTGVGARGAVVTSSAPVNLTVGNVATTGNGVTINAGANAVTLTTGTVTATEAGATGTVINSTGAVTFTGGQQTANGANALRITGGAGPINATVAGAATTGTGTAVAITGTGPLTFGNTGSITTTGATSNGINISGVSTAAVNCGNVSTTGANSPAVVVSAAGNTSVTCGTVATTGTTSDAITVSNTAGTTTVTGGTTSATGAGSRGIVVNSSAPAAANLVTVNTGVVTANGNAVVVTTGAANLVTTANGNITSTTGAGLTTTTAGGATTVTQSAGTTITAATDAIRVNNTVGGAINVNALGTLVANNGSGVFVNTSAASADPINVTTNIIRSTGAAGTWGSQVRASAGSGDITITSNGTMSSAGAPGSMFGGILALTSGTSNRGVTVNVNANIGTPTDLSSAAQVLINNTSTSAKRLAVNITKASIFGGPGAVQVTQGATSLGDIVIVGTGTGTLSATGPAGVGINARILNPANPSNILVDVRQSVVGTTQGINATTLGSGAVTVEAGGNVTSAGGTGITTASAGTTLVRIAAGTTTTGVQGASLQGAAGNTLIVNGTLRNTAGTTPYTVLNGGPFTLTLGPVGTIVGPLAFTTGNDTFNNQGTFALPATLDFLAGNDVFNNSGTLTAFTGASVVSNLEAFNNSGLIDLRNGSTLDRLTLSGNFVGSGTSTLGVDVGAGSAADRLIIGGAATGSTRVLINGINGQFFNSAVIVDAGTGSSATAFNFAPVTTGFVQYDLVFLPGSNDFVLNGAPTASAVAPLKLVTGAREVFYKGNDLIGSHLSAVGRSMVADDVRPGASLWMTTQGLRRDTDNSLRSTVFGINRAYDLSTQQDFFNLQGGVDFGLTPSVVVGFTGGIGSSVLKVSAGTGTFNYRSYNVGAYAGFDAGIVFGSALVRYERYDVSASSIIAGYSLETKGHAYGARGELGLRLGGGGISFEPIVSLDYARVKMDNFRALSTDFAFGNPDGLRGKAGARLGGNLSDGPTKITAYVRGMVVHEFRGEDRLTLTNSGTTLFFDAARPRTYGEGAAGVDIESPGGVRGFIELSSEFAGGVRGSGGRAGLAVRF